MRTTNPLIGIPADIKTDLTEDESFVIERVYAVAIANSGGIPIFIPSISENVSLLKDTVAKIDGLLLPDPCWSRYRYR